MSPPSKRKGAQDPSRASSVVVVTGLSGAGKSTALRALADAGWYCVDNLPPSLVQGTVEVCRGAAIRQVALGIDVRVGAFLEGAHGAIVELARAVELGVLFLDATDDSLVRRFSETRRPHPMLAVEGGEPGVVTVTDAVQLERDRLASIRALATAVVDTSHMSVHDLRRWVLEGFAGDETPRLQLRVMSFGFKHGVPLDADLVFDVRFLDNPHFVRELREQSGEDDAVRDFVLGSPGSAELLEHLEGLVAFLLPRYEREGKSYLTIAIGCTGGRHRSVAIAAELSYRIADRTGRSVGIVHRDVARGAMMRQVKIASPTSSRGGTGSTTGSEP